MFLFSIAALPMMHADEKQDLSLAISQIRQLQQTSQQSATDFTIVFAKAISTLQTAAELSRIITKKPTPSDSEKSQRLVSVRLPYALPSHFVLHIEDKAKQLSDNTWQDIYQSHITSPETPPPLFHCS